MRPKFLNDHPLSGLAKLFNLWNVITSDTDMYNLPDKIEPEPKPLDPPQATAQIIQMPQSLSGRVPR